MKFYLIVAKGSKQGMPILVTVDLFLIGSDKMCQLRKDGLGPKHCAFVTREKKVFVRDMDSGQETVVNGSAVPNGAEWPLHSGDRVKVGPLEFLIQFREHALSKKDLEEWAASCLDATVTHEVDEESGLDLRRASVNAANAAQSIFNQLNAMKGLMKGRLRIGVERGTTIVRFNDTMLVDESEIALIKKELCDNLNKPNLRILLDLKNVKKLSSGAVIMLADFYRWLRPWGSSMALCRIRSELASGLAILEVESIPIFRDKKAALPERW